MTVSLPTNPRPIAAHIAACGFGGVDINTSVDLLRRYVYIERSMVRSLAGWFLAHPDFEAKYAIAHHLWHHVEHVTWLRERLVELRGGKIEASVSPALQRVMETLVDAPDAASFTAGKYAVFEKQLLECYRDHLACCDEAANAYEVRMLRSLVRDAEDHVQWAESQPPATNGEWQSLLERLLTSAGGISGLEGGDQPPTKADQTPITRFSRPATIIFGADIQIGALTPYDQRRDADKATATREDFKVFFNEFYAAALLASVLYDADQSALPWDFFRDFAHHFWDEVRHSQFGFLRLKELGFRPDTVNPILFEQSQGMSVLHRITYLTLGLETYFMPRKRPRIKAYIERGDPRSQFFADHDWSDEANHVRYGKRWVDYLLKDDLRTGADLLAEVQRHLEQVTGQKQTAIAAPF